ncbi:MAG: PIG-L deacetylase family protein [Planctomycetota bacterium]
MSSLTSLPLALVLPILLGSVVTTVSTQEDLALRAAGLARIGGADEIAETGHLALAQAVRDAGNDSSIAIVASHPDDQYLLPAAYLRLHHGYRVTVIMMTRGEGGQNNFGPEVGDTLATLRTLETEECARSLGLRIHYLNRADDGYCRTAEEAFESWGENVTVRALASAIRRTRPDIVLTTHHPEDTHGHDLAVVRALPLAIRMAGDPNVDLASGSAHGVTRAYRSATPTEAPWFELPTDDVEPDRGLTYREIAYRALTRSHRSQSPFRAEDDFFRGAHRFVGIDAITSPPRNIHFGLTDSLREAEQLGLISAARNEELRAGLDELQYTMGNRPALAARALAIRAELAALDVRSHESILPRIAAKRSALARIAMHAIGLRARLTPSRSLAAAGESIGLTIDLSSATPRSLNSFSLSSPDLDIQQLSPPDVDRPQPWHMEFAVRVPNGPRRIDPLTDLFRQSDFRMPCICELRFELAQASGLAGVADVPIELPLALQPPVDIDVAPDSLLLTSGAPYVDFNLRVRRSTAAGIRDRLRFDLPTGVTIEPPEAEVDLTQVTELGFLFRLRVGADSRQGPQVVRAHFADRSRRLILHRVDVKVDRRSRVGLIRGVNDSTRNVLSQLGCVVEILTEDVLPTRRLDDLDTILVDVRALNHHRAARADLNRLLQFASDGGRLVFLYHKDSEIDTAVTGRRFWPNGLELSIGRERVTREDAPVEVLLPNHALLNVPNVIAAEDWDGWSRERGLYFPSSWHSQYQALVALRDPDREIDRGALLYVTTGRGEYVYCALALHRQLENLHSGACRILANLVSFHRQ